MKATLFMQFEHSNPLKEPKIATILAQINAKKTIDQMTWDQDQVDSLK